MAITKIKPIKSTLKKALDYIENPDKTEDKLLVSSFGCSYETADIEFGFTISQALCKGSNVAHHLIQSFSPEECAAGLVTPQKAHEIGKQLADKVTNGQHEYVLTTHIDKGNIHNHIIFCSVNFINHKKYVSNKKTYYNIRRISDELCREYGLSVVEPGQEKGRSYIEYQADKNGGSYKQKLRLTIDTLIPQVSSLDELLKRLQERGYEIKYGKYISCRASDQERFTRLKTLGIQYSEDSLTKRITGISGRRIPFDTRQVNLIIDIQNCIKAQESKGYEHWAKVFNVKQAANTLNYLTENKISTYEDLHTKIEDVLSQKETVVQSIKDVEQQIATIGVILKNLRVYQETKAIYDRYHMHGNSEKSQKYESHVRLHEAAVKALHESGIHTFPDMQKLQEQYDELTVQKDSLYFAYNKIKKELKEIDIVRENVDKMLSTEQSTERNRQHEL